MKLTLELIQKAMTSAYPYKGDEFWKAGSENAKIVEEATKRGYLRRYSTTQVEWTEAGLAKARKELAESKAITIEEVEKIIRETCNNFTQTDLASLDVLIAFRDEILARLAQKKG